MIGLSSKEVLINRKNYGSNILTKVKRKSFFRLIIESASDPIIKILLIVLMIKIVFLFRDFDWFETIGILIAIILASVVSAISEYGSESAFENLEEESCNGFSLVIRDSNVKKISGYITKKVSERLQEIFNSDHKQFEEKWDDLKIFIEYGMLSDEKFYERAQKFVLLKDTEDKYYTLDEYKKLIEGNQTDKDGQLVYLYATDKEAQYSYIDTAVSRGYDVLLMNGQLDPHFIGMLEQKLEKSRFVRVDSDLIDKLIKKSDTTSNTALDEQQRDMMTSVFKSQIPAMEKRDFLVMFEPVGATAQPIVITQNEFMRRMKDMAAIQSGMAFYGELPDSYNLIVNTDHPLSQKVIADTESACKSELTPILDELKTVNEEIERLQEAKKDKKDDEIPVADKEALKHAEEKAKELRAKESDILKTYADQTPLVRQLVDLALLSNNMLKGEALSKFIKRPVEML